jgi:hypothetical protein
MKSWDLKIGGGSPAEVENIKKNARSPRIFEDPGKPKGEKDDPFDPNR